MKKLTTKNVLIGVAVAAVGYYAWHKYTAMKAQREVRESLNKMGDKMAEQTKQK